LAAIVEEFLEDVHPGQISWEDLEEYQTTTRISYKPEDVVVRFSVIAHSRGLHKGHRVAVPAAELVVGRPNAPAG
jgi:hypothetical protein